MPWVKEDECVGCGICVQQCPVGAISMNANQVAVIDNNKCTNCAKCFDVCPRGAIHPNSENPSLRGRGMGGGSGLGRGMGRGHGMGRR